MQRSSEAPLAGSLILSNPAGLYDPTPNGYSHVAAVASDTKLLFISGQGGENADGELQPEFRSQVRQAIENLQTALAHAGAKMTDVARLTVLVVDHSEARLNVIGAEIGAAMMGRSAPACTLIPVPRLALDGMLFEIDAVAVLAANPPRSRQFAR